MAHFMSDLGQDLQLQGHTIVWDQMVEIVHRLDPLLAIPQLNVTERSLINCQLFGVLRLERRLALDVANLVDAQVKVIGDLPGQPMGIPSIQDRLLDDRPLLICQFLCHVTKLGIDRAQEKEKRMGLYVWVGVPLFGGCLPGEYTRQSILYSSSPASLSMSHILHFRTGNNSGGQVTFIQNWKLIRRTTVISRPMKTSTPLSLYHSTHVGP